MSENPAREDAPSADEAEIRALYQQLLESWNRRDAEAMAATFAEDGESIGFDGSVMTGRAEIAATLRQIFADHPTGAYVWKVRVVRPLAPEAAVLCAVVGIVPHGKSDINPALNAHQTVVAAKRDGRWRIVLLQNTPAQFHGRPDLADRLTEELRHLL